MRVRYYYPATSSKLQFVLYADGQKIAICLSRRITSITKQIKKMLNEHNSKYSSANRMSWEDVTALPVYCSSFTTSSIPDSTKQQAVCCYYEREHAKEEVARLHSEMKNCADHYTTEHMAIFSKQGRIFKRLVYRTLTHWGQYVCLHKISDYVNSKLPNLVHMFM